MDDTSVMSVAKSAVFFGPERIKIKPFLLREPGPNELLVRIEGCGLCASNIPVWEGRPWFKYPLEPGSPGYEGWGIVAKTGSNVNGFSKGNKITFLSQHAFSEYDIINKDDAVLIPKGLSDQPFPGEPLACAMNIFKRADIKKGEDNRYYRARIYRFLAYYACYECWCYC